MSFKSNNHSNALELLANASEENHSNASEKRRVSCHRCGNMRKLKIRCSKPSCPHTFCGRCVDKMVDEFGGQIFTGGCPVCKEICCCSNKTTHCSHKHHCYRKCPVSKLIVTKDIKSTTAIDSRESENGSSSILSKESCGAKKLEKEKTLNERYTVRQGHGDYRDQYETESLEHKNIPNISNSYAIEDQAEISNKRLRHGTLSTSTSSYNTFGNPVDNLVLENYAFLHHIHQLKALKTEILMNAHRNRILNQSMMFPPTIGYDSSLLLYNQEFPLMYPFLNTSNNPFTVSNNHDGLPFLSNSPMSQNVQPILTTNNFSLENISIQKKKN